jgi:hypothetical protein
MPYIGRPLQAGNLSVDVFTGNASTTVFTLTYSVGSSNSVGVYLDGVRQLAGTDFTASGTTLTFTTAPANLVGIDVYFLGLELSIPTPADGTVTTAKIAANAVDETKLKDALVADFTEVVVTASDSILLGDATDSGNTKRDTVQGILDLAGGGWELIGTQTASNDATVTQTGLDSTYDSYVCVFSDVVPATDGANFRCRVGNSGGLISTSNTYSAIVKRQADNSASPLAGAASRDATDFILLTQNVGSASGEGASGVIWIWGNQGGSMKPHINWKATNLDDNGHCYDCSGAANHDNAITMDRFGFHFSSGNITSGRFTFFGVSHA